jgi:hypothetical protein
VSTAGREKQRWAESWRKTWILTMDRKHFAWFSTLTAVNGVPALLILLGLIQWSAFAQPGDAHLEDRRVLDEKASNEREVVERCTADVTMRAQAAEISFRNCSACTSAEKQRNIARLHQLRDEALQECIQKGANAASAFLDHEERRLRSEIDRSRARIKDDQKNFQRLGLATVSDAFDTWETLADDRRRDLEKGTILSALTLGLQAIKLASLPIGGFTPPQANSLIARLRAKGITEPFLEEGIRKVAMTSGKPETAKNVRDLADTIDHAVTRGGALVSLSNGQLEALATLPAVFLKSPDAIAAEALGETVVNFVFAEKAFGVIAPDLNGVLDLPDRELANVQRLSASIRTGVDHLNDAKRKLDVVLQERRALQERRRDSVPRVGH